MNLRIAIAVMGAAIAFAVVGDSTSADTGADSWGTTKAMYHINARDSSENVVPEPDSVVRPLYNALVAIQARDAATLKSAFVKESQDQIADFVRCWHPRQSTWSLNIYEHGIDDDRGWGYAVVRSHRTLGASLLHDLQASPPFADVVFLTRTDGNWRLTSKDLDPERKQEIIAREERAIGQRLIGDEEWRKAELKSMRAAYISGREMWGESYDPDTDPNYETSFKEWLEYQQGVRKRPPVAKSFDELMAIHGGRLIDPPISFLLYDEPEEVIFETPLHGVRMAFYIMALRDYFKPEDRSEYPMRDTWRRQSLVDLDVPSHFKNIIMQDIPLFPTRFGRVQLLAYIPVSRDEERYCVLYYRILSTDALRFTVPESAPEVVRKILMKQLNTEYIYMGRLILEKSDEAWLTVKSIPYISLMDGGQMTRLMIPGGTAGTYDNMDKAMELLENSGLPDHFKHMHSDDECMPLSEAIERNMFIKE